VKKHENKRQKTQKTWRNWAFYSIVRIKCKCLTINAFKDKKIDRYLVNVFKNQVSMCCFNKFFNLFLSVHAPLHLPIESLTELRSTFLQVLLKRQCQQFPKILIIIGTALVSKYFRTNELKCLKFTFSRNNFIKKSPMASFTVHLGITMITEPVTVGM
jgi:hypothetical protein